MKSREREVFFRPFIVLYPQLKRLTDQHLANHLRVEALRDTARAELDSRMAVVEACWAEFA